jgi:hypothetical protein
MLMRVFEKPRRFRTRDGREAVVFCQGRGSIGDKFFGVLELSKDEMMDASWMLCGKYNGMTLDPGDLDLVEEL